MIQSITVENFHSIGAPQTLSFEIGAKEVRDDSAFLLSDKTAINLVNCFVGKNGSGKTTILKALSFLYWLSSESYNYMTSDKELPVIPHKFWGKKSTKIEIRFIDSGRAYKYNIELKRDKIISEYFGEHFIRGYSQIFKYVRKSRGDWDFKSDLDINNTDIERFKYRKNVSVLSALLQLGYLKDIKFFKNVRSNVTDKGPAQRHPISVFYQTSKILFDDKKLRKEVLEHTDNFDLGVDSFSFEKAFEVKDEETNTSSEQEALLCNHSSAAGEFVLPLIEESNGTQQLVFILSHVLPILKNGGVVIMDELESSLHPLLAKKFISLFSDRKLNSNHAQLIFSTHQHMLLNDRSKTQIFIAEKSNNKLETEVFRLDDVDGVRNDENFFHKYIAGTYGGTPNIDWY